MKNILELLENNIIENKATNKMLWDKLKESDKEIEKLLKQIRDLKSQIYEMKKPI